MDRQGLQTAVLGSSAGDSDSHLVAHIAESLTTYSPFLDQAIQRLLAIYLAGSADALIDVLSVSALYDSNSAHLLQAALRAYHGQRWIEAIHCLVTSIEAMVRRHVDLLGGIVYKPRRRNPQTLVPRDLDALLRDDLLIAFWQGRDVPLYFRVLLTDPLGWNLRNNVCHGELEPDRFNRIVASQLLHALFVLRQVRQTSPTPRQHDAI